MARSAAASGRRAMRLTSILLAAAFAVVALRAAGNAFLPSARSMARAGSGAAAATVLGAAAPVFAAEEAAKGFLNFGKIELGGGFAINLDIPETGVVNIAVLVAGLVYLLGPLLSESMATREKEIQMNIKKSTAKTLEKQAAAAETALKELQEGAEARVESFVQQEAITRGYSELKKL